MPQTTYNKHKQSQSKSINTHDLLINENEINKKSINSKASKIKYTNNSVTYTLEESKLTAIIKPLHKTFEKPPIIKKYIGTIPSDIYMLADMDMILENTC